MNSDPLPDTTDIDTDANSDIWANMHTMSDYEQQQLHLPGYGFSPVRDLSATSLPSLPSTTNQEPYCLHPATDASFDTFFSALYGPLPPTNPTQLSFDSPYLYSMDNATLPYATPPQPPHLLTRPAGSTTSGSASSYIFPVASPTSCAPPPKVVVHVNPPTPTQHLPLGKFMDGSVLINTRPAAAASSYSTAHSYSTSPHQHPYLSQRPFAAFSEKRKDALEIHI
ncbi:hypothetical protein BJ741DRAFT_698550 [Chytriomyces cf. hyalinus JEL632]|nr:hypothetical protein BJ741DRAFT_698550 [Chytriomyces cf. hyalinus JEL632]